MTALNASFAAPLDLLATTDRPGRSARRRAIAAKGTPKPAGSTPADSPPARPVVAPVERLALIAAIKVRDSVLGELPEAGDLDDVCSPAFLRDHERRLDDAVRDLEEAIDLFGRASGQDSNDVQLRVGNRLYQFGGYPEVIDIHDHA